MTIRTSAPVRLDFAGAWTDVAPFALERRGVVVNAALDMRTHVELQLDQPRYELWSRDLDERVVADTVEELGRDTRLALLKAAIRHAGLGPCTLHTSAEAPPGSGLGTSGAASVALCRALDAVHDEVRRADDIASAAWRLETVDAAVAGGQQDQYAAALGGFQYLVFDHGVTSAAKLEVAPEFAAELARHVVICYTGRSRFSGDVINRVMRAYATGNVRVTNALTALVDIADAMAEAFRREDVTAIGRLLAANWIEQQQLDESMRTGEMAALESAMRRAGAVGGKAAGAGAGGSMFFVVPGETRTAIAAAARCGATVLPTRWAVDGARVDRSPRLSTPGG